MATSAPQEITRLLLAWGAGEAAAFEQLMPLVYGELRLLARRYLRAERAGHTLQATALVNEAYLRLIEVKQVQWQNRAHFFGMAARLMRRVLVDFARSRNYQKRGGGARPLALHEALMLDEQRGRRHSEVVALDEALQALAKVDERKSRVVEMRFFGGLSEKEIAAVLGVAPETVRRDWRLAKSWLLRHLSEEPFREEKSYAE